MALEQARHAGDVVRSTTQEVRERVSAVKEAVVTAAPPRVAPGAPVGPPVIPTTWLEPREQYLVAVAAIGLIEVSTAADKLIAGDESVGHLVDVDSVRSGANMVLIHTSSRSDIRLVVVRRRRGLAV